VAFDVSISSHDHRPCRNVRGTRARFIGPDVPCLELIEALLKTNQGETYL
jgi:hypothetical protein